MEPLVSARDRAGLGLCSLLIAAPGVAAPPAYCAGTYSDRTASVSDLNVAHYRLDIRCGPSCAFGSFDFLETAVLSLSSLVT